MKPIAWPPTGLSACVQTRTPNVILIFFARAKVNPDINTINYAGRQKGRDKKIGRIFNCYKTIVQLKNYINMNDNSKIVVALLAGLAAGAALGILFAPDKGTETRDKLNDSLKKLGDSIRETAANEIDNLVGLKDKVVDNIKSKIKTADEEYQDDLEHA
jgi:gas vesicle protein